MKGYVVTGASKGLGLALTRRLLAAGHRVIGISRTAADTADSGDRADGAAAPREAEHYTYDLKRVDGIEALIATIVRSLEKEPLDALTLINNAGMLEPIMPLEQADSLTLTEQMNVNLLAPMLLMSAFIRATKDWPASTARTIVNISSGAGKKPYSGWSGYCATKAGLDMLTRCVGLEQGDGPQAVKVVSIAPGVVDTGMQELIRGTESDRFPEVERFVGLKQTGGLYTPDEAAERIINVVEGGRFAQGDVLDIRHLPQA
ncbi:(S)-benzoin forming benzil reductase [Paenibacillus elgii]|uniref:(S)-benzoin forming benzil reductase n=1 Tax=Paenibacillus elgii TaxID=189691 RepID=UPI000248CC27|nr:(S)-benzoin forming benzil reductase [Paenibacillus elgii]